MHAFSPLQDRQPPVLPIPSIDGIPRSGRARESDGKDADRNSREAYRRRRIPLVKKRLDAGPAENNQRTHTDCAAERKLKTANAGHDHAESPAAPFPDAASRMP